MINWFNASVKASLGEIYIYGEITDFKFFDDDVTPGDVKKELDKLKNVESINIYVNSPGGGVFAGVAIYNELKRINKPITAYIDGLAASIASLIVLAADKVVMPSNAMFMIHNPWTCACGDSREMRNIADKLDKIADTTLVDVYAAKTGMDKDKIKKLMDDETWLGGKEAVDLGFADEVIEAQKVAACYIGDKIKFNDTEIGLSNFKAFPKEKFKVFQPKQSTNHSQQAKVNLLRAKLKMEAK